MNPDPVQSNPHHDLHYCPNPNNIVASNYVLENSLVVLKKFHYYDPSMHLFFYRIHNFTHILLQPTNYSPDYLSFKSKPSNKHSMHLIEVGITNLLPY